MSLLMDALDHNAIVPLHRLVFSTGTSSFEIFAPYIRFSSNDIPHWQQMIDLLLQQKILTFTLGAENRETYAIHLRLTERERGTTDSLFITRLTSDMGE